MEYSPHTLGTICLPYQTFYAAEQHLAARSKSCCPFAQVTLQVAPYHSPYLYSDTESQKGDQDESTPSIIHHPVKVMGSFHWNSQNQCPGFLVNMASQKTFQSYFLPFSWMPFTDTLIHFTASSLTLDFCKFDAEKATLALWLLLMSSWIEILVFNILASSFFNSRLWCFQTCLITCHLFRADVVWR